MKPIKALLVDDESYSRDNLCSVLRAEPRWHVIGECGDAGGLHRAIACDIPDVAFLDVQLPDGDGVELARALQRLAPRPLIVFTTAFQGYAGSAFEVPAIDYLLKPFDERRIQVALRRVEHALTSGATAGVRRDADRYLQRLVIRSIGRVELVDVALIDWLAASGNYVEVHVGSEMFLHRERLRVLEDQLDPAELVRIHRSIIVQRAAVKELRPLTGGDYRVVLRSGVPLRLSRTYRSALEVLARSQCRR